MKKITILSLLVIYSTTFKAQFNYTNKLDSIQNTQNSNHCKSDEVMKTFYKNNPEDEMERQLFEIEYQHAIKMLRTKRKDLLPQSKSGTFIIPVVFHVYGTTQWGKPVNLSIIQGALTDLNNDFQGLTADWSTVDFTFSAVKAPLDIMFCLAAKDPQGVPTNGVIVYPAKSGYGNWSGYDAQISADSWDNYKYMNVYIMGDLYNDGDGNNSGVAWQPSTSMSNAGTARVVYNGKYLGNNTTINFRSVLTHEFGHWLNLYHTFYNGCNSPGDYVNDTPYDQSTSGCSGSTSCTAIENTENFMDYSSCYKMLTQGQVTRAITALNLPSRFPLWQEANLAATGCSSTTPVAELSSNSHNISIYPNPTFGLFSVKLLQTESKKYNIEVKNMLGQIIFSNTIRGNTRIDLSEYKNGIYTVTIYNSNISIIKKVIKN